MVGSVQRCGPAGWRLRVKFEGRNFYGPTRSQEARAVADKAHVNTGKCTKQRKRLLRTLKIQAAAEIDDAEAAVHAGKARAKNAGRPDVHLKAERNAAPAKRRKPAVRRAPKKDLKRGVRVPEGYRVSVHSRGVSVAASCVPQAADIQMYGE